MVGHGHAGKTSLVSAMLYTSGATQRLGRVDDGSAPRLRRRRSRPPDVDFDRLRVVEWGGTKINISILPASHVRPRSKMVLPVVDAAIVVVDGRGWRRGCHPAGLE